MLGPKLLTQPDCANYRDFLQYYRESYLGYCPNGREIYPAAIGQADGREGLIVYYHDGQGQHSVTTRYPEFLPVGRFGTPLLGCAKAGPSYAYLSAWPVRESHKGLVWRRVDKFIPNGSFLFGKYARTEAGLAVMFPFSTTGRNFNSEAEMRAIYGVFNKKFWTAQEAFQELEAGTSLGVPINIYCGLYLDEGNSAVLLSYKKMANVAEVVETRRGRFEVNVNPSMRNLIPILNEILPNSMVVR